MDMWLCVKRAIAATERAKQAYEDGKAKVAEAGKALQDHAHLLKEKESAERQVLASEEKVEEMNGLLEAALATARDAKAAKEAVQVALEESERAKAAEIEAAVRSAIRGTARLKSSLSFWIRKWARRWRTCCTGSNGTTPGRS